MKIYVDEMPIKVRQRVLYYDDGKTNCVELEFTENVKPTEICNTQSQKQLAISELENLKKEFDSRKLEYKTMENSFHIYGLRIERIFQIIDDQIKELKGE
jgi:hypothetical protein